MCANDIMPEPTDSGNPPSEPININTFLNYVTAGVVCATRYVVAALPGYNSYEFTITTPDATLWGTVRPNDCTLELAVEYAQRLRARLAADAGAGGGGGA